jgi:hypothetical protein
MDGLRTIVGLILLGCLALGLRVCAVWTASPAGDASRALQFLQCLIGTATVLAVAGLGWSLVGPRRGVGWLAALGLAVYPPQVSAATYPQAALWAGLALACLLGVAVSPRWQTSRAGGVLAGCLAGLLVLLEPAAVGATPICVAIFWWGAEPRPASQRLRGAALGRLLIPAGVAAAIVVGWYGGSWLLGRGTSPPPAGEGQFYLQRLRDFLLAGPAGPARPSSPLDRFATIACLVLAAMGCCTSWPRWRTLWPTAAIFAAVTLSGMWGWTAPASRLAIEPLAFLWAALAVAPPLARLFAARQVRVYRPGERAEDPLGRAHVLRGPHYDVGVRRRAG